MDHPTEALDRGLSQKAQIVLGVTWTFFVFAFLALVVRFYLTRKFGRPFTLDDWVMLLALGLHTLFQVFFTLDCMAGFGYDTETMTTQQIVDMTRWSWATVPVNILANMASRLSIAIFLVHFFSVRVWFKWLVINTTALLTILGLVNFVFVFFQASPLPANWDPRIPAMWRLSRKPYDILISTELVLYVLLDFIDGILPPLLVWKFHMPLRQKLCLMIIMAGTLIAMGIGIGRVAIMNDNLKRSVDAVVKYGMNRTKVYVLSGVTSLLASVEISLLIILSSLPKLTVVAKLPVPDRISSSMAPVISRARPGTQFNPSKSEKRPDESGSDVEPNKVDASRFPEHPSGYHPSTIQLEHNDTTSQRSKQGQVDHITLTETYAITHNQPTN
ncbi:integral membrane protein [Xylaria telfairii]|nr:integral membrane protein [Xylaria telfairii]